VDGVGDERAGDTRFDVSLRPIVENGPGILDRRGGVSEIVGDNLIGLDIAVRGQVAEAGVDDRFGRIDGGGASGDVRF
jgi:hypothetical protein